MEENNAKAKREVIRRYLQKNLSHCLIQEDLDVDGPYWLTLREEGLNLSTVHISAAILADHHLSALELRWALKERDIASQVRWHSVVPLDHETLRIGDLGAIGCRPLVPDAPCTNPPTM